MNFADLRFWIILFVALFAIAVVRWFVKRFASGSALSLFDKCAIFGTGVTLLGYASSLTLVIFLFVTAVAYFGLKLIVGFKVRHMKLCMWLLIVVMLLPLLYYKYSYFFCSVILDEKFEVLRDMVIPIGISFYTFQKIGFVVDTLLYKKPIPPLIDYVNFAGFFPQIVAGPIERRESLLPQMEKFTFKLNWDNLALGVRYIILGLFFKLCLADNIAAYFIHQTDANVWKIWHNNVVFGFRIYFDFAGYGITAVGLAKCLGINLIMNFRSPYTSPTFGEFWRRWHISLTNWFRDYIYFNIGGSRTKFWAVNIMFVFLISGLWHGAAWNFVIWGGLCGVGLVVFRLYKKLNFRMWAPLGWLLTMLTCFFIWMFFYETRLDVLAENMSLIFDHSNYTLSNLFQYIGKNGKSELPMFGSFLFIVLTIVGEWISLKKTNDPYLLLTNPYLCGIMIFLIVMFTPGVSNEFIYFAF